MTKEQQLAAVDTEIARLERECMPHGVPGITLVGAMHGMQLVATPGTFVQLTELNHDYRVISIGRARAQQRTRSQVQRRIRGPLGRGYAGRRHDWARRSDLE